MFFVFIRYHPIRKIACLSVGLGLAANLVHWCMALAISVCVNFSRKFSWPISVYSPTVCRVMVHLHPCICSKEPGYPLSWCACWFVELIESAAVVTICSDFWILHPGICQYALHRCTWTFLAILLLPHLVFGCALLPICKRLCIWPRLCLVCSIAMGQLSIAYIPTPIVLGAGGCSTLCLLVSVNICSSGAGHVGLSRTSIHQFEPALQPHVVPSISAWHMQLPGPPDMPQYHD